MDNKYFKTKAIQAGFSKVEFRLRFIVMAMAGFMAMRFDRQIVITSTFRDGDTGVHGAGHGCDVRCKDWTPQEREEAESFLKTIHYEGKPKTVFVHGEGDNIHFHIQTSWRRPGVLFIQNEVQEFNEKLSTALENRASAKPSEKKEHSDA